MINKVLFFLFIIFCLLISVWSVNQLVKSGSVQEETAFSATPTPTLAPISAEKLMSIVNDWRYSQGFQPYTKNDLTCNFAEIRVKETQINWSHQGFSGERMCGNLECWAAENLSRNYQTEKEILNAWLASPSHSEELHRHYQYSCIKCDNNYCVQEFANL